MRFTLLSLSSAGFRRSFRLWRRTSYRRRRQSCTSCSPTSSGLSTPYEEVALYQRLPQDNHRLIILIGERGVFKLSPSGVHSNLLAVPDSTSTSDPKRDKQVEHSAPHCLSDIKKSPNPQTQEVEFSDSN